jgi:2-C-methyl-D-erythritol 4-phosphate cytidylyltransferase
MNSVIILAAGSGSRMKGSVADKTLTEINNTPVFLYSIKAFIETNCFEDYVIVYRDEFQKK